MNSPTRNPIRRPINGFGLPDDGQKIYEIHHTTQDGTRVRTEIAARSEITAILRWRLAYKHDTFISCEVTL
jgi:hypothetical protein